MTRSSFFLVFTLFALGCGAEPTALLDGGEVDPSASIVSQAVPSDNPFVFWESDGTVVAYPMDPEQMPEPNGGAFSDLINVQYAVDVLPIGGTVILSATDLSGVPRPFDFGAPVWEAVGADGNTYEVVTTASTAFTVFLSKDVTILGEGKKSGETPRTTIIRGSNVFRPSEAAISVPISLFIKDVDFLLSRRALLATAVGGFRDVEIEGCRFGQILDAIWIVSYERFVATDNELDSFWRYGAFLNPYQNHGAVTIVIDNLVTSGPKVLTPSYRAGIWLDSYYGPDPSTSAALGHTVFEDNIVHMTGSEIWTWGMAVEPEGHPPVSGSHLRIAANVVTLEDDGVFESPRMFGIDLFGAAVGFLVADNLVSGKMRMGIRLISPYHYTPVPAGIPSLPANNTIRDNHIEGRFAHENELYGSGIWLAGSNNSIIENTLSSTSGSQSAIYIWPIAIDEFGNRIPGVSTGNVFVENTISGTAWYGFKIENGDANALSGTDFSSFAADIAHIYLDEFSQDNCIDGVEGLTLIPEEPVNGNAYHDPFEVCAGTG